MGDVHPEFRKALAQLEQGLRAAGLRDLHSGGIEMLRTFAQATPPPVDAWPPIYRIENRTIIGPGGPIPLRIYRPSDGQAFPVTVWFHGGGWVFGDLDGAELDCRRLANDVRCVVVSVDYRWAPETCFPGAFDDCWVATTWVAASSDELAIDPGRIAVAGDSAGGNLAACVALSAHQYGLPLAFQLLVYPATDATEASFERPSCIENAEGYLLTRAALQWFWDCYVPDASQRSDPRVSPIHADDLSGLAPAFIITAEFDPLRDEGEAYGAALAAAGVPVEVKRYSGMIHGFYNWLTEQPVDEVIAASADAASALRRAFGME